MELSLDLSLAFVPKTVSLFLGDVSRSRENSEKLAILEDFIQRLEDEMRKVEAFKRELPLCMLLVNDGAVLLYLLYAITRLKEEKLRCIGMQDPPVTEEEFMPLKTNYGGNGKGPSTMGKESCDKKNWMSSVQLWNTDETNWVEKVFNNRIRRTIVEEHLSHLSPKRVRSSSGASLLHVEIQSQPQPPQHLQQNPRKQRRCWSSELHRRFVDALQQLGGAQVATPKQIRELMQVEGLTNDEVKSHLQKYRLHIRRFPTDQTNNGLWMAQDQCGDKSKGNLSQSGSPQGPLTPLVLGGSVKGPLTIGIEYFL
ncbi:SANT/Myb domain [Sesbania bispinosa]|nr:SANT/Myb domain [Sesbania bispinosa]